MSAGVNDLDPAVEVEVSANTATYGEMTIVDALQNVLKQALVTNNLVCGICECPKVLDCRQASLCVLNIGCTEGEYIKLVEALCSEHNINLIKVSDAKKLGEWAGLCKIDLEGNPHKVVGASCVVVKELQCNTQAFYFSSPLHFM